MAVDNTVRVLTDVADKIGIQGLRLVGLDPTDSETRGRATASFRLQLDHDHTFFRHAILLKSTSIVSDTQRVHR